MPAGRRTEELSPGRGDPTGFFPKRREYGSPVEIVSPFGAGCGNSGSLQLSDGKGLVILKGHAAVQSYTILINAVDGADRLSECEQNQSQKIDGGGLSRLPVQLLASSRRLVTDPALTAEPSASLGVFVTHSRGAKAGQATAMLGQRRPFNPRVRRTSKTKA